MKQVLRSAVSEYFLHAGAAAGQGRRGPSLAMCMLQDWALDVIPPGVTTHLLGQAASEWKSNTEVRKEKTN